jgi:hypothetical protein
VQDWFSAKLGSKISMDKKEFHWLFGVVQGWFSAKLGSKISSDG